MLSMKCDFQQCAGCWILEFSILEPGKPRDKNLSSCFFFTFAEAISAQAPSKYDAGQSWKPNKKSKQLGK